MARKPMTGQASPRRKGGAADGPARKPKQDSRRGPAADGARIRVRMYRQGLGDCFLVSLLGQGGRDFHLMIDCGVILGTPDAADVLKEVVGNVIATTGGHIDLLAVTHEHYDHVAAFVLAGDLFAAPGDAPSPSKLSVDEVWFAWTEDPNDADARRLRADRAAKLEALAGLAERLDGMAAEARAAAGVLDEDGEPVPGVLTALRFFGVSGSGQGTGVTAQAMENAAALAPAGKVAYRRPGEILELPKAPGIRIYVLGPPDDDESLRKTDSTTEVYHLDAGNLVEAVRLAAGSDGADWDRFAPFDPAWSRPLSDIVAGRETGATADFLNDHYFGPKQPTPGTDLSWRRIDRDWLGGAEDLALALDSATNNTSLVLAIELVDSGGVLLFPADAQVGNILSWQTVDWGREHPGVSAADLLRRTVFYKVGHHGSHNATLKAQELELMPQHGLTAFIPVDHAMAMQKGWGRMPLPGVVDALRERCGDHLVRIDEELPGGLKDISEGPRGGPFGSLYYEWVTTLQGKS